jgi:hypothetical protein
MLKKKAAKQNPLSIWRILHNWRWPCRPKHVVKSSESQNTIKLHADENITCNNHWTIQCSRMLKYSITLRVVTWRWNSLTFPRNILFPSSRSKNKPNKQPAKTKLQVDLYLVTFFPRASAPETEAICSSETSNFSYSSHCKTYIITTVRTSSATNEIITVNISRWRFNGPYNSSLMEVTSDGKQNGKSIYHMLGLPRRKYLGNLIGSKKQVYIPQESCAVKCVIDFGKGGGGKNVCSQTYVWDYLNGLPYSCACLDGLKIQKGLGGISYLASHNK